MFKWMKEGRKGYLHVALFPSKAIPSARVYRHSFGLRASQVARCPWPQVQFARIAPGKVVIQSASILTVSSSATSSQYLWGIGIVRKARKHVDRITESSSEEPSVEIAPIHFRMPKRPDFIGTPVRLCSFSPPAGFL